MSEYKLVIKVFVCMCIANALFFYFLLFCQPKVLTVHTCVSITVLIVYYIAEIFLFSRAVTTVAAQLKVRL